jgi:hypothetical protein
MTTTQHTATNTRTETCGICSRTFTARYPDSNYPQVQETDNGVTTVYLVCSTCSAARDLADEIEQDERDETAWSVWH